MGAGSVVLKDVPSCATVAGVPARVVGWCSGTVPALACANFSATTPAGPAHPRMQVTFVREGASPAGTA